MAVSFTQEGTLHGGMEKDKKGRLIFSGFFGQGHFGKVEYSTDGMPHWTLRRLRTHTTESEVTFRESCQMLCNLVK